MVIGVLGIDECLNKFKNLEGISIMTPIRDGAYKIQKTAKQLAPVDTGTLRATIKVRFDKKNQSGSVFTNTEYAIDQEFGTRYQKGTPFLLPAYKINEKTVNSDIESYIKEELFRIGKGDKPTDINPVSDMDLIENQVKSQKKKAIEEIFGFKLRKSIKDKSKLVTKK